MLSGISFLEMSQWVLLGLGLALAGMIAFVCAQLIATPIKKLTVGMRELASGNFDVVLPGVGRKDEIGDIAGTVDEFKASSGREDAAGSEKEQEIERTRAGRARRACPPRRRAGTHGGGGGVGARSGT